MLRMRMIHATSLVAGLLLMSGSFAQVPSDAPAGTTGLCKDGSYTSAASKRGACSGHKGVQTWYASGSSGASSAGSAASAPAAAPTQPAAEAPPSAPPAASAVPATKPAKSSSSTPAATAAPGGGPGLVWVNKSSKVYHCQGDRWYGKTKSGAYMSEADAKAQGNRPDHGKPCS